MAFTRTLFVLLVSTVLLSCFILYRQQSHLLTLYQINKTVPETTNEHQFSSSTHQQEMKPEIIALYEKERQDTQLNLEIQYKSGKLDWHKVMRYTVDPAQKKIITKNFLTKLNEQNSNQFSEYCPLLADLCVTNDEIRCSTNLLCYWCSSKQICVSKLKTEPILAMEKRYKTKLCPTEYDLEPHTSKSPDAKWATWPYTLGTRSTSQCQYFIPQNVVSLDVMLNDESHMFYHFLNDVLPRLITSTAVNPDDVVFVYSKSFIKDIVEEFADYFALFSSHCVVDATTIPKNVCLLVQNLRRGSNWSVPKFVLHKIGFLDAVVDPVKPPKFCLIRRVYKRFILNYREVLRMAESMGFEVFDLVLEEMRLEEQVRIIRECSVLAGVHGSGLGNVVYMHPGAVLIQIAPYKVCGASHFVPMASNAGVNYLEWQNENIENTVFHEHYLTEYVSNVAEFINMTTCVTAFDSYFYEFWINQDTIVDLSLFNDTLAHAKKIIKIK